MKVFGITLACCLVVAVFALIYFSFSNENSSMTGAVIKKAEMAEIDFENIKKGSVAGQFYPDDRDELDSVIEGYLSNAGTGKIENVRALIVPHAGYEYSGMVAAKGFVKIKEDYDKVIIIAGTHNANAIFNGISIGSFGLFETPFGQINVSSDVNEIMSESKVFIFEKQAFDSHVVEVELPFLQKRLSEFEIIPLVTGILTEQQIKEAARIIEKHVTPKTLIVVSTDLSHYHAYQDAVILDQFAISSIVSKNEENIKSSEMCGREAVLILNEIARDLAWNTTVLEYKNSGDVTGNKESVVGYAAIVFYGNERAMSNQDANLLNDEAKRFLLNLSRTTLEEYVKNGKVQEKKESRLLNDFLAEKKGCFVTLNKKDELRGCTGHIFPQEPLYNCIIENTINAASRDERFDPIKENELKDVEIEISILSVPKKIEFVNWQELFSKVTDKDGIVLYFEGKQSTFLPQVWQDIPDKIRFFSQLCLKQGSRPDCWQQDGIEIEVYRAEVFSENEFEQLA